MKNVDAYLNVRGESRFLADRPPPRGGLHAAVVSSPCAKGRLKRIDGSAALEMDGVHAVFTAGDIPGENQIGTIADDEPLLAESEVHYIGQPVAVVVAESAIRARAAAQAVAVEVEEEPGVFDARDAARRNEFVAPPRTLQWGDAEAAFASCAVIAEGTVETGAQEHIYLETQGALAVPGEGGGMLVISSTQSPTAIQRGVARVLGRNMNRVEVDVARLGGGFGGKEDQATPWACMAAVAAERLGVPVSLILGRQEDIRMTGKRHPYSCDYRIGLDSEGRILAYEVCFYQDSGAAADLSMPVMERSFYHATNSYSVPSGKIEGFCCRTNIPPNTAFRGFGAPQAIHTMECALDHAARLAGRPPSELRRLNLLRPGDRFPYGMAFEDDDMREIWDDACSRFGVDTRRREIRDFNRQHTARKKGFSVIPLCFGIAFTNTMLNQASALVHVYTDGSVGVSTAAVEMGQGINNKLRRVTARVLSVPIEQVKIETTNTTRAANTSPTAASTAADLNGNAVRLACEQLLPRLVEVGRGLLGAGEDEDLRFREGRLLRNGEETGLTFAAVVDAAWQKRVSLSAQAHYATPDLRKEGPSARPFAYHVPGIAVTEATLDVLRGTYRIDRVQILHDAGETIDPLIDRGQAEGALVQGIGWLTLEELVYREGRLHTDTMTAYKVPDVYSAPAEVDVQFRTGKTRELGIFGAKAIGEPPFVYGTGAFLALLDAVRQARPDLPVEYRAPLTPERVFMMLHGGRPFWPTYSSERPTASTAP